MKPLNLPKAGGKLDIGAPAMSDRRLLLVLLVVVVAIVTLNLMTSPSDAERAQKLDTDIAHCQARGGRPHLGRLGDEFYLKECWLTVSER